MAALLAACGGFLLAVLWMDLLFDVQVLRAPRARRELPEPVLASIAAYYRRATTEARPMGHLIGAVMALGIAGSAAQLALGEPRWLGAAALALALPPILLAVLRVYPNAVRLGGRADSAAEQSALARAICRDHLLCLAAILAFLALELGAAAR